MKKRVYHPEFKEQAVALCKARGNVAQVSRELGVHTSVLKTVAYKLSL